MVAERPVLVCSGPVSILTFTGLLVAVPVAGYQLIVLVLNFLTWFSPDSIAFYGGLSRVPADLIQGLGQICVGVASALALISLVLAFHVFCAELLSRTASILFLGTQVGFGGLLMHASTHTWASEKPNEVGFTFEEFDYGRIRLSAALNHSKVYEDSKAIAIICRWLTVAAATSIAVSNVESNSSEAVSGSH